MQKYCNTAKKLQLIYLTLKKNNCLVKIKIKLLILKLILKKLI